MSISLPTYTRREIPLLGRRHRRWAIYTAGLRRESRRPAALFAIVVGTLITTVVSLVTVLFAPLIRPGQPIDLTFFVVPASNPAMFFFVTLMAGVVGGGLIADDLDSMALTLYLSRPVTAADYLAAKASILGTLTSLIAILPLVLTPFLGALLAFFPWDIALEAIGISVLLGTLLTGFFTSIALFLSSLTRRRAYAAAAVFAIVFGLIGAETALVSSVGTEIMYLSPSEDFLSIARAAFGAPTGPVDWAVALGIFLGVTVLAALATWFRMRAIEVVSG